MKKITCAFVGILAIIFMISSCSESDREESTVEETVELRANNYQNKVFGKLSKVVSVAVNDNPSFRSLLKTEALIQFDGDYDVLLYKLRNLQIQSVEGEGTILVKNYLGNIYNTLGITVPIMPEEDPTGSDDDISDPDEIIDYIVSVFPEIQISIPVHAEDWDETNYIPTVVFIPEDYDEATTTMFKGFNNNVKVLVDAVNEPDDPVLVIGLCERLGVHGIVSLVSDATINLSAATSAIGVSLTWTVDNPNDDVITGYRIYRKPVFANEFELIFDNLNEENKTYNDNNVESLLNYSYYVKAYNAIGESESSNIVTGTAPGVPAGAADFSANHFISDEIELRWSHEPGGFIDNSTLFKRVIGVNGTYVEVGTFPVSVTDYIDNSVIEGKRVNYKIVENINQGSSNSKYDFIEVPYRDVSTPAPVIITEISYDEDKEGEIEGWGRGRPELQVSVVKAGQSGDAGIVQEDIYYDMTSDSETDDVLIFNWLPGDWSEVITFKVTEVDGGPDLSLNVSAGFDKKDSSKTFFIKGSIDLAIEDILSNSDEIVGRREHRYRDEINDVLEFPKGGVKIHLSD